MTKETVDKIIKCANLSYEGHIENIAALGEESFKKYKLSDSLANKLAALVQEIQHHAFVVGYCAAMADIGIGEDMEEIQKEGKKETVH